MSDEKKSDDQKKPQVSPLTPQLDQYIRKNKSIPSAHELHLFTLSNASLDDLSNIEAHKQIVKYLNYMVIQPNFQENLRSKKVYATSTTYQTAVVDWAKKYEDIKKLKVKLAKTSKKKVSVQKLILAANHAANTTGSPIDITKILQELINLQIPTLNSEIFNYITSNGLDPMKQVIAGPGGAHKSINLGFSAAKAFARYNIVNLVGLKHTEIVHITVSSAVIDTSVDGVVTVKLSAKGFAKDGVLTAELSGDAGVSSGIIKLDPEISGKITVNNVIGGIELSGEATIKLSDLKDTKCSLHVDSFALSAGAISVKVELLPSVFDPLIETIITEIVDGFKGKIFDALDSTILAIINDALNSLEK